MLYINVPYEEKDAAKALGARWNAKRKQWYIPDKRDYHKFSQWIMNKYDFYTVLCDHFYIVEGIRQCPKCKQNTHVICFGFENYWKFEEDLKPLYWSGTISICGYDYTFPSKAIEYAQSKWNLKLRYSESGHCKYMGNCCEHCNALQANYLLFGEYDTPFYITSIEDAKNLTLYKLKLSEDIILPDIGFGCSTTDLAIKEFSPVVETNIVI